jgi:hypothetical protein
MFSHFGKCGLSSVQAEAVCKRRRGLEISLVKKDVVKGRHS